MILQKGWLFGLDELTEWMRATILMLTIAQCDAFSLIVLMEGSEGFCELLNPWPYDLPIRSRNHKGDVSFL